MRNSLLQMSHHKQHCPLLAVCDLNQNQRGVIKRFSGGFGTGNSSLCGIDFIAMFGFGGDAYFVC